MQTEKLFSLLTLLLICCLGQSQVVNNTTELNNAINAATPGTTITLADGTWNNVYVYINKNGTASNPITITVQTPGSVLMTGNSRVYMRGQHITLTGLVFQNASNLIINGSFIEPVIELDDCDWCKVINNKIDSYNGSEFQKTLKFKWVLTEGGQHVEIAHNSFIGKYGVGSIINTNRTTNGPDYLKIHHNYFADRTPINGVNDDNDQDAIRIGVSTTSLTDSYSEVYENYFYNFFGEIEVISNKSGKNKYYKNTFRKYSGTLTLRHGNDCDVYGNYFFAENNFFSGGVRVIGEGHKVYNNYIEGINSFKASGSNSNATGGINVSNGKPNSALNEYYRVINAQVVNNTFVNCDYGLRIGTQVNSTLTLAPLNLTVANNVMYNTSINPYQTVTSPTGSSVSQGNQTNLAASVMTDDGNFHRITGGSSPINASVGTYAYVNQDVLTGARDANVDAGAEEYGANGNFLPYTAVDVGVNVGFSVAQIAELSVSPGALNFGKCSLPMTFDIAANVGWTITENLPWLTLNTTSGSGPATITATVGVNNTGASRSGTITIAENPSGNNLSATLSVVQTNTNVAQNIPIVGATSIGMFANQNVAVAHAYDDDISTYWTGNPDAEPEVSITFDLGAPHILNTIGINFLNADLWTTSFGIAVAENPNGPFTTVIFSASSAPAGVTVNTEQPFGLNGITGRYVKFIGYGNSSASNNFVSITNVNVYGYQDCSTICDPLIIENSNPIPMSLYKAVEIQSAGTVIQPNVKFEAGDCIQLNPGFEVTTGAIFEANLIDCN